MALAWTPLAAAVLFAVSATSSALGVVDTNHPITFEPTETTASNNNNRGRGSLFGYSLALTKTKLYVGAPIHNVQGAVFQCEVDGRNVDGQGQDSDEDK